MTTEQLTPLLEVQDLRVHFTSGSRMSGGRRTVKAVDGVSLSLRRGETLGLVGESGCGKSTTGRAVLQLIQPTSGSVKLDGIELTGLRAGALRRLRRRMQMVFQDPYSSLDARMTIAEALAEPLRIHGLTRGRETQAKVRELLDAVGLPASAVDRYPHEFSGGQRQRIAIARALAVDPELLICDEPISALDVSVQAQVLNLFDELQERYGLTYLFIAHDLAAVRHVSHRIAVMYLGGIVETGDRDEVTADPLHPYTQALISAVPRVEVGERTRERIVLSGDLPSPASPPSGCRFSTRCPFARDLCRTTRPELVQAVPGRRVACHFWSEIRSGSHVAEGLAS